jgi:DNA-directed RNA polymerase subunit E'/Rpb7
MQIEGNLQKYKKEQKIQSIYSRAEIQKSVLLEIKFIDKNLKQTIEDKIKFTYEGKCIAQGYIKTNSCNIKTYSGGEIVKGNLVKFTVLFECDICYPVAGMLINCVAQNITLAGITATSANEIVSPIYVLLPRDYHINYNNEYFNEIKVNDKINISVIEIKFEINDSRIYIIGKLKNKEY